VNNLRISRLLYVSLTIQFGRCYGQRVFTQHPIAGAPRDFKNVHSPAPEPRTIVHLEQSILSFIRHIYVVAGWPGVVLMMTVESAAIPLPSEIIMPFAGWFLIRDRGLALWWLLVAAALGALGNTLGSWLTYWIGAAGGRPFLERHGRVLLITQEDLARADRWFQKYGIAAIFVARLMPVVRTFISLPAGVSRMNLRSFTILTFGGSFLWSLALVWAGYVLGAEYERVQAVMRPLDVPIAVAGASIVVLYVYRHVRRPDTSA
jgi:membrane protein DedA with SNARE-associated domain